MGGINGMGGGEGEVLDVTGKLKDPLLAVEVFAFLKKKYEGLYSPVGIRRSLSYEDVIDNPVLVSRFQSLFNKLICDGTLKGFPDVKDDDPSNYDCKQTPDQVFKNGKEKAFDNSPTKGIYKALVRPVVVGQTTIRFADIDQLADLCDERLEVLMQFVRVVDSEIKREMKIGMWVAMDGDNDCNHPCSHGQSACDMYKKRYASLESKSMDYVKMSNLISFEEFKSLSEKQVDKLSKLFEIEDVGCVLKNWKVLDYIDLEIEEIKKIIECYEEEMKGYDRDYEKLSTISFDEMLNLIDMSPIERKGRESLKKFEEMFGIDLLSENFSSIEEYVQYYIEHEKEKQFPSSLKKIVDSWSPEGIIAVVLVGKWEDESFLKAFKKYISGNNDGEKFLSVPPQVLKKVIRFYGSKIFEMSEEEIKMFKEGGNVSETWKVLGENKSLSGVPPKLLSRIAVMHSIIDESCDFSSAFCDVLGDFNEEEWGQFKRLLGIFRKDKSGQKEGLKSRMEGVDLRSGKQEVFSVKTDDLKKVLKSGSFSHKAGLFVLNKGFLETIEVGRYLNLPAGALEAILGTVSFTDLRYAVKNNSEVIHGYISGDEKSVKSVKILGYPSEATDYKRLMLQIDLIGDEIKGCDKYCDYDLSDGSGVIRIEHHLVEKGGLQKQLLDCLFNKNEIEVFVKEMEAFEDKNIANFLKWRIFHWEISVLARADTSVDYPGIERSLGILWRIKLEEFMKGAKDRKNEHDLIEQVGNERILLIGKEVLLKRDKKFFEAIEKVDVSVIRKAVDDRVDFSKISVEDVEKLELRYDFGLK